MPVENVGVYMVTAPTRVINDGRVTIPADVRRELGIEEGDYVIRVVVDEVEDDGLVHAVNADPDSEGAVHTVNNGTTEEGA